MCANPAEARRHFVVSERAEVEENEFNLNLPRYVDTFKPEQEVAIADAMGGAEPSEWHLSEEAAGVETSAQE